MKVFLTGGTGFVGQEILRQLLAAGHQVRALVRPGSNLEHSPAVETVSGDVTEPQSLQGALAGCDAVIHLVGIIREFPGKGITFEDLHTKATKNILQAAGDQGVKRYLQMSANGTREDAVTDYHKTKWAAEVAVRQSDLDWTIFRPSLIFGPEDEFVNMLADLIRKLPVVPVMGDGQYRLQPVAVRDVAAGYLRALETPESIGQTYHCGGPKDYSYDEVLDLVGQALGKGKVCKLHQPLFLMKPVVGLLESIPQFPITSDQLQMLLEGNCCDPEPWRSTFDLQLTGFTEGIQDYLKK